MTKISKPGIYDIDIERYHHDPHLCDGPSISSSGLRALLLECPARYWAYSPYNPNRFVDETTKALDLGRAAHCLVLGEPAFNAHFFVSPYDAHNKNPGYEWYNKTWKPEVAAGRERRTLLKPDDFEMVKVLAEVQRRSAQAMRAFEDGKPEQSVIWRDRETGIWLRSRPDWLPNDPSARFITEFKTCLSIKPDKFARDAFGYGYHMQVALMVDGIREVMGVDPLGVCLVAQEKDPPYLVELRMFGDEQLEWGRKQYRRALQIFAQCLKTGEWPGYTPSVSYIETPYGVARDMQLGWTDDFQGSAGNGNGGSDGDGSSPEAKRNGYTGADYLAAG